MGFTNDRSGEKSRRRWISGHHGEVRIEEQSLVGREPELAALARLIGAAGVGRGRVALMLGEAGIGKTRLAEAAKTMARQSGFDVAWGRCSWIEMPSYWPWRQVLTNLLGETDLLDLDPYRTPPIHANPVTSNPNLPILRLGVTGFESADCSVPARSSRDSAGFVRWLLSFRPERSGSLGCHMKPWRPYRRTNLA